MKSPGFFIRPMRATDVEAVREFAGLLPNAPHWPLSVYLAALDPWATPRRIALVAANRAKDLPIGFAIASIIHDGAELETVAVRLDRQRQGVGRALIDEILGNLRKESIRDVSLEVRESNLAAAGLYLRAGFKERGRRGSYYTEPVEDAVVMGVTLA
jgi:ribosomal-protein-alanine N-acetyltransferase